MSLYTRSASTASVTLHYICRCAYCDATIRFDDEITAKGYAYAGDNASEAQKQQLSVVSDLAARANLPFELDYAEQRLAHYRDIVASGKLKRFLETGKAREEDAFKVQEGSTLEKYLKAMDTGVPGTVQQDTARLNPKPYRWKDFDKKNTVKCHECGKVQPFCEDISNDVPTGISFLFFCLVTFGGLAPFIAGIKLPPEWRFAYAIPLALGFVVWFVSYRLLRKKRLRRIAALPWRAEDLPVRDAEFPDGESE